MYNLRSFGASSLSLFCLWIFIVHQASCSVPNTIGDGHCVWYDVCAPNPNKTSKSLNCQYYGEAKPLRRQLLFKSTCPELAEEITDYYGEIVTCCSEQQVTDLAAELASLHLLLSNCPACFSNLRKNFCDFTCHPRHSAFLNPSLIYESEEYGDSVWVVTQYSSNTYVYGTYDSCDTVYFGPINGPAMEVMCGPWGTDKCTPERFFDYLGHNNLAPFDIDYVYSDKYETAVNISDGNEIMMQPLNPVIYPCNTTDPDMACRCSDCEETCKAPPQEEPLKDHTMVGEVRLYTFIIIIAYVAFAVLLILYGALVGLPGREKDDPLCCAWNKQLSARMEESFQLFFKKFSRVITHHPFITIVAGAVVITVLSTGITRLEMTTDPVELWASSDSRSKIEKNYYDENFGPFYRTNQLIITPVGVDWFNATISGALLDETQEFGPVFNSTFMLEVLDLQLQIMNLTGTYDGSIVTLKDICIKPMAPNHDECMIESPMSYWQDDQNNLLEMMYDDDGNASNEYLAHLMKCVSNSAYISDTETCLAPYGGPVFPYVALGGFLEEGETLVKNPKYERATALIITILGQNYVDKSALGPALAWEAELLKFMEEFSHPMMDIAYYSERSIEDEIKRESKGDVLTILISYLVMFTYVAISLGNFSSHCNKILLETKIVLGLCSVVLVFLSVISAIGLCAYMGVTGTFFVIEVIPFLVLAVGVDNIFLLVQTWQREERLSGESIEDHVARVVSKVGPSMILATSSESICFFLGALSKMPAVYAFSIFAGVALTIDFLLQITCLVAFITLDAKRMNENRYDFLCCFKGPKKFGATDDEDLCLSFFRKVYSPFLLSDISRIFVLLTFLGGFCTSCIFIPRMDIGLEQDIGMPDDSYVIKYFDFMAEYLSVGSPVYFVIKEGYDFTDFHEQNLVCQSLGCNNDSLLAQIFWTSESPTVTYIATGASSWLDSYFLWVTDDGGNDDSYACCRLDENGDFIDSAAESDNRTVRTCLKDNEIYNNSRPLPEYFMTYLPDFLIDNPHGTSCPQAGHAAYGTAVVIEEEGCSNETATSSVGASYFMSYHTILRTSKDFSNALEKVYELTDYMTEYLRNYSSSPVEVFPYSIFYVYYEQYLTMWETAGTSLLISVGAVFLVLIFLSGLDLRSTCINLTIIVMIVADIMGFMIPCGIQLNAISLVNLVMAVGISIEFCSHITHSFAMSSQPTKVDRATDALTNTGSSVLSGITLTKFGGIIVLCFANSQVIKVFYFRMYLLIVLLGAAHGLIFLPVLLSLVGPSLNPYIHRSKTNITHVSPTSHENHGFQG